MANADRMLAAELGLPADAVQAHRRDFLQEGSHWLRTPQGAVNYTPEGRAAVLAALGAEKTEAAEDSSAVPPPESAPEEKKEPPPPAGDVLCPILLIPPNPGVVVVQLPDGSRANILVRDNRKLQPRHKLRCRHFAQRWLCVQPGIAVISSLPNQ